MKEILITTLILVVTAMLGSMVYLYQWKLPNEGSVQDFPVTSFSIQTPDIDVPVVTKSTSTAPIAHTTTSPAVSTTGHPGMKLYHNEQFGFEFWYPEGWEMKENIFGSPYSKFNLTVMKIDGKYTYQDEIFNIVTPEFADNAIRNFLSMGASTSSVAIDNVYATEYRGNFESNPSPVVDVPFGAYRMLIAFEPAHEKELNSILTSFKFTK